MSIYESENWVTNTASKMLPHSSTSRNTGEASLQFTRLKSAILQDSKLLSAILQQTDQQVISLQIIKCIISTNQAV